MQKATYNVLEQIKKLSVRDIITTAYDAQDQGSRDGWAVWNIREEELCELSLSNNECIFAPEIIFLYKVPADLEFIKRAVKPLVLAMGI